MDFSGIQIVANRALEYQQLLRECVNGETKSLRRHIQCFNSVDGDAAAGRVDRTSDCGDQRGFTTPDFAHSTQPPATLGVQCNLVTAGIDREEYKSETYCAAGLHSVAASLTTLASKRSQHRARHVPSAAIRDTHEVALRNSSVRTHCSPTRSQKSAPTHPRHQEFVSDSQDSHDE